MKEAAMARPITPYSFALVNRRLVVGGLASAAAIAALPRSAVAATAAGTVSTTEGTTTGLLEGLIRELSPGAEIYLQEIVQTGAGARLSIAFGQQTTLKLGERTRIRIEQSIVERGGELTLASGALLFDRPDGSGQGQVIVKTPFAVIAARGTGFWAGPSNGVTGIFAAHGIITVRNRAGRVTLTKGLGTDLTDPDVAPTPPKEWGAARVQAALKTVN
jgi:hypothetical protein